MKLLKGKRLKPVLLSRIPTSLTIGSCFYCGRSTSVLAAVQSSEEGSHLGGVIASVMLLGETEVCSAVLGTRSLG